MEQPQQQRTGLRIRGPKQLAAWILSGGLLVAALVLAGQRIFFTPGPVCTLPSPTPLDQSDKLAALFQEAKTFIRQGKWTDAKAKLLELQAAAPDYPLLSDYLKRAEEELPNQQHLEAAREALAQRNLVKTQAELNKVSQDTTMFEEVSKLRRTLQETVDSRVREAKELFAARQLDQAKAVLDEVLAVAPENSEAQELSTLVRHWIADSTKIRYQPESTESPIDGSSPGPKEPGKPLGSMQSGAVDAIYSAALVTKAKRQWARTLELVQHIRVLDPKHTGANRIIAELHQQAENLYMQDRGYALKDSNPEDAIPRYREIMDLTLPDDELHQKAKSQLDKLAR